MKRGLDDRVDAGAGEAPGFQAERFGACVWGRGGRAAAALPGTGPLGPPCYPLAASRRAFAALTCDDGTFEAAMATGSPVCGFLPWRAARRG